MPYFLKKSIIDFCILVWIFDDFSSFPVWFFDELSGLLVWIL